MKIAVNDHFGGFSLAPEVFAHLGMEDKYHGYLYSDDFGIALDGQLEEMLALRSDPRLIAAIEAAAPNAHRDWRSGDSIRIVEVPDDVVTCYITDYDGRESVTWAMCEINHG